MARNDWRALGAKVKSYPQGTAAQYICDDITGRLSNSASASMRSWAESNDWSGVTLDQVSYALSDSVQKDPILFPP
jgi:hypothetical protein